MAMTRERMSLAGEWAFALDEKNCGIRCRWFDAKLPDLIRLPGTTDEAGKGEFTNEQCVDRLSRVRRWIGPAWYKKTVKIPKRWAGKRIVLSLERTKDSQVWVDGTWAGGDDSLSTPHDYDLTRLLPPGKHTIAILVDNAKLPPVGPCHQVDERTQTNWNGIVGRIELTATAKIWIDNLQAWPDPETRRVKVTATVVNDTAWRGRARLAVSACTAARQNAARIPARRLAVDISDGRTPVACEIQIPENVPCWDEFNRSMIDLTMTLNAPCPEGGLRDAHTIRFGLRGFTAKHGQFVINGRPTFLRGKNDCALFPLTGYAPMDREEWRRLLSIARDHGINHYRFHTWCPPEAAFQAADELGIFFQIELPNKREITAPDNHAYKPPKEAYETLAELEGDGGPPAVRTGYLYREGERMLKAYGNHPSFVMMTLGNELGGDEAVMRGMCEHFRTLDNRHLYAMGTGHFHWDLGYRQGDEFWVTRGTSHARKHMVRGASWETELHIDHQPPSTMVDYSPALLGVPVPVVGHEMAQYEVFPDFTETRKYTGVLEARFLDIFRQRLEAAGMLDQAADFCKASGAISAICHREDVEAALRTPGFGGFQMLDLQDFSGQGVALIGLLDVFMDSKGLITPEEWRRFCCETVPLLWMTKYTWTTAEIFRGRIRVAHYGPADLPRQSLAWRILHGDATLAAGTTRPADLPTGTVTEVDLFCADLAKVEAPAKLSVELAIPGTDYRNAYDIWVYPEKVDTAPPPGVLVARSLTPEAEAALAAGGTVLLLPDPETLTKAVAMAFQSSFWSPMFRNRPGRLNPLGKETPGTQGILCDPSHPLFAEFPTEFHTNWQWWQLVKNSRAMILDDTPRTFRPLVQVIDGFDRNHKLGLIFEARVGGGRLLVCSIDLPNLMQHPEARQLLASIQHYAASTGFRPKTDFDISRIRQLL